ncbi:tripartite tricarboxylate transporter substrate binding protein [Pseudorhodoplanes sp.]|jgi:tripartite-type tricarboxylate transporter receptor subunit TctC|uniref:Bug family tripartite tricarboxylate transporter substrate binding protein n=1 Tax=Pseudorhodoplanes sp. TaxID=1934341 RepID=UPI002C2AEA0B|nr:tripartite tricarboxylate transporter substrate binding protein [Pseudorhodoplanes sp.]HWV40039.1 tripartite tricarboxylate transporter substrate binding protein [Pseudorhodoplanes sp.]
MRTKFKSAGAIAIAVVASVLFAAKPAPAQTYPDRPIRVIVPFPAGGVLDTLTRAIGDKVRPILGQPWVIENKPGANGSIGMQQCAQAEPDGYTFCSVTAEAFTILPHYDPSLYERYKTLVPVTEYLTAPGVVYASAGFPAKDLRDVVKAAKAKPGDLSYSSWGQASSPQVFFEWLKKTQNVDILHVPFRGSTDAINEVVSGRIPVSYVALGIVVPHFKSGKLTPLAVIGDTRSKLLPDTPSLGELGFDFPYKGAWFGMMAPAGTPMAIREKIASAVRAAVNDPEFRARFLDPQDYTPVGSGPAEFEAKVKREHAYGADIVRITGIKAAQ